MTAQDTFGKTPAPAKSKSRRRLGRFVKFMFALAVSVLVLLHVHDYPQTIHYYESAARGENARQFPRWRVVFSFFNEAGSGLKFLATNNEKYMIHFPSPSHIVASRTARAESGDWRAQMLMARMYARGEWVYMNKAESDKWLARAMTTMPEEYRKRFVKSQT